MDNFWQTCSAQLELELTPQQFSAWIKPLIALDIEDGKLRIAAPNRFKLDWVKTQFASRITALAAQYFEAPTDVQFVLDPALSAPKKAAAPTSAPAPASTSASTTSATSSTGITPPRAAWTAAPLLRHARPAWRKSSARRGRVHHLQRW